MLCPVIDHVFAHNMGYMAGGTVNVGGFGWNLLFSWIPAGTRKDTTSRLIPTPFTSRHFRIGRPRLAFATRSLDFPAPSSHPLLRPPCVNSAPGLC